MKPFPSQIRAAVLVAALAVAGGGAQAQEIVVSAAASLTDAFRQIGTAFERSRPGARVVFNFAASGPLLAQIRQGAPVDVFASADQETMDRAAKEGLLAGGTRVDFARNALVLVVPAAAARAPGSLGELAAGGDAWRRIATGTPATVPAGRYTEQAARQAGLAQALAPRWIYAESVRQVLNYVARGEVDAGFVYRTDALVEREKTRIAFTVPTTTPVRYPIARIAAGSQAALAGDFIAFVRGGEGQRILGEAGFSGP
jgi:molybdate transport system substrate-binding protein